MSPSSYESSTTNPNPSSGDGMPVVHVGSGGCWTCRIRRKKCDEQRDNGSCKTCKRLTLDCLGWGVEKPEFMRDKNAIEEYKASIKSRLTQKGLIRGQPRSNYSESKPHLRRRHSHATPNFNNINKGNYNTRPRPNRTFSTGLAYQREVLQYGVDDGIGFDSPNLGFHTLDSTTGLYEDDSCSDSLPRSLYASPSLSFHSLSASSSTSSLPLYNFEQSNNRDLSDLDDITPIATTYPAFLTPSSDFTHTPAPVVQEPTAMQEESVMRYFDYDDIRKLQFPFSPDIFKNITYQSVVEEPNGPVTHALCALVDLYTCNTQTTTTTYSYFTPDPQTKLKQSLFLYETALTKTHLSIQQRGGWPCEADAVAALHLLGFSLLSSGMTAWDAPLKILLEWLGSTVLPKCDRPWETMCAMPVHTQVLVKAALWLDIFSSISLMRPCEFYPLWKRLLQRSVSLSSEGGGGGGGTNPTGGGLPMTSGGLQMHLMTGCPDEAFLAIAEVSSLSHWMSLEDEKGCLSLRELARRGNEIEQRLRANNSSKHHHHQQQQLQLQQQQQQQQQQSRHEEQPTQDSYLNEHLRDSIKDIFRETAALYLYVVLNGSNPGVPENKASVDIIIRQLIRLQHSVVDRAIAFPICLAGCLTDNTKWREMVIGRFQFDEGVGNYMQIRILMEAVWQKRDTGRGAIDMRVAIHENRLNLLLV